MSAEQVLDVRYLEPPEPMERLVEALDDLPRGDRLRMLIHREPYPVYRMLELNGYRFSTTTLDDGTFEVLIWKAS